MTYIYPVQPLNSDGYIVLTYIVHAKWYNFGKSYDIQYFIRNYSDKTMQSTDVIHIWFFCTILLVFPPELIENGI